jgi:hypothetical protein
MVGMQASRPHPICRVSFRQWTKVNHVLFGMDAGSGNRVQPGPKLSSGLAFEIGSCRWNWAHISMTPSNKNSLTSPISWNTFPMLKNRVFCEDKFQELFTSNFLNKNDLFSLIVSKWKFLEFDQDNHKLSTLVNVTLISNSLQTDPSISSYSWFILNENCFILLNEKIIN